MLEGRDYSSMASSLWTIKKGLVGSLLSGQLKTFFTPIHNSQLDIEVSNVCSQGISFGLSHNEEVVRSFPELLGYYEAIDKLCGQHDK